MHTIPCIFIRSSRMRQWDAASDCRIGMSAIMRVISVVLRPTEGLNSPTGIVTNGVFLSG